MTTLPRGIGSNSAIQAVLNKLVDRLDAAQARGSAAAQTIAMNESLWPSLYKAEMESDKEYLWEQFLKLAQADWIQITPLNANRNNGYDANPRIKILDVAALRGATSRPDRPKTSVERWRDAIDMHLEATEEIKKAACDYCIEIQGRSMGEIVQRLNTLKSLAGKPLLLREVSSQLFWGLSKVLDNRAGLVAVLMGLDECPFPESPIQLQVYLPQGRFSGVLFIENLMSFERAIGLKNSAFEKLALVYASGFKGGAARLRSERTVSLYYSRKGELGGDRADYFESWLFGKSIVIPVYFWGDLDWSGMRILAAMRKNFPDMKAWETGYLPMIANLLDGNSHSPEESDKSGQRPINSTGCEFADSQILPLLIAKGMFVDQEGVVF